ncbi:MAG: peptidoglycan DD-metalloendopeptidase family protein [Clostridium sp.]|jgi:murein DD-endopeptidase MepM/ murein hydrolase activator NlpD|nr:peptidoglycan DD-metalloendopeptidase family protein [Clostridium sp.]
MKSKSKRFVACLLGVCLLFGLSPLRDVLAITSESIRQKQEQIKQAEKEAESLESNISDIERIKKELINAKNNLSEYIELLDQTILDMTANIEQLESQIDTKEAEIITTTEELEEAKRTKQAQYDSMSNRIKFIYENKSNDILNLLLQSIRLGNFLNLVDYMAQVKEHDQEMVEEYERTCEYIDLCIVELDLARENLETQQSAVEVEKANMEELLGQKTQELQQYENDIRNKEAIIAEYEAQLAQMEETVSALEEAIAEEKRRLIQTGQAVLHFDGGVFKFPLANYTRISDEYGYRIHPTLHVKQFHNGVDFAAPAKTPIYAAYDGRVVAATYSSTMGNYIMVDHGDELYTIYMHASVLYVEKGDIVVKGETIAGVGTTGRSTGNHLHFSVRLNGAYVSPWNYLSE